MKCQYFYKAWIMEHHCQSEAVAKLTAYGKTTCLCENHLRERRAMAGEDCTKIEYLEKTS
jgi:hypothetical protein